MPKPRKKDQQVKPVKPIFHIYCEGEKTEPNYLRTYIEVNYPTSRLLHVNPIQLVPTKKNTPKQLVEEATKKRREVPEIDIIWVVYDREAPDKYSDELHQKAMTQAQRANIQIALSNVCFEFWILLHFRHTTIACNNCADVINHAHFKSGMNSIGITNYEKGEPAILKKLLSYDNNCINTAMTNAKRINRETKLAANQEDSNKPYRLKPYTDMHLLLCAINEFMNPAPPDPEEEPECPKAANPDANTPNIVNANVNT